MSNQTDTTKLSVDSLASVQHINENEVPENCSATCNRDKLKSQFKDLKQLFKSSHVQASFLPQLSSDPSFSVGEVSDELSRLAEMTLAAKEKVKESKALTQEAEQEVENKITKLLELMQQYQNKKVESTEKREQVKKQADALHTTMKNHSTTFGGSPAPDLANQNVAGINSLLASAQNKLDTQLGSIQGGNEQLLAAQNHLETVIRCRDSMRAKIQAAEARIAAKMAEAAAMPSEKDDELSSRLSELEVMQTWSTQMSSTLSKLSGVRVGQVEGSAMAVYFDCLNEEYRIDLSFNPADARLLGGNLTPNLVNVSDIVKEAIQLNNPRFLVRELRNRVFCRSQLQAELAQLRTKYALSFDELAREVVCTLPAGAICCVKLPQGYPEDGASVEVTALDPFRSRDQETFDEHLKVLQSKSAEGRTLVQVFEEVETFVNGLEPNA